MELRRALALTSTNLGRHEEVAFCTGASVSVCCVSAALSLPLRPSAVIDGGSIVAIVKFRIRGGWRSRLRRFVREMGELNRVDRRYIGRRSV